MQIIPVIDLKEGRVVYAQHGNRTNYQPINSHLCQSSSITDVLDAFLNLYDFNTFYIADLDAICQIGSHQKIIADIVKTYPNIEFWVDTGIEFSQFQCPAFKNYQPVVGSESQQSTSKIPKSHFILSLDFKHNKPLGPIELFENNNHWPENVIIMTLARVGSQIGPDFVRLKQYCQQYSQINFIAAGGIRHINDLTELNKTGVKQALLASALHSGAITAEDIKILHRTG